MEKLQNLVIHDFIRMTERIANGKTNVLHFGSEEMTFYRGEIHMIKMVGDCPGIFISEMARNFNITRAVVAKTIRKLEERGFLNKEEDAKDRKRLRLFLTEKGKRAYALHHEYHQTFDRPLFAYLESLDDNELRVLQEFLKHANSLVENHF
ncbi:DNA-binding MarR family transcriptional regulator [Anaerosolibacter carboniphilus]|uniref:DNA-binding MarR family transcriptional regulator n=1 Tax=Anaerosolibacter carboniphilus TaxID=1417629 RepID=A0A841KPP3_9FIRM|nr:MarR family transcriptional regulator [Anaerosolibacter carboniphilus]MBB6215407.1 DNA-binding MarR family transcriptional regulator [Anaerosolibacter carboniphilus]